MAANHRKNANPDSHWSFDGEQYVTGAFPGPRRQTALTFLNFQQQSRLGTRSFATIGTIL